MERPSAGIHYPGCLGEFQTWFQSDADCLDYTSSGCDGRPGSSARNAATLVDGGLVGDNYLGAVTTTILAG